jgi:pyruvate/2-oxoglutarate dehydrogenase complex dihydrolipoamide dehydrogenase (E3) component
VIATGSSAVAPPLPGLAETPHVTNRGIFSLERLPATMVILGAGPIGIEMAQAFARLGTGVTVVDRAGRILPREDADMSNVLVQVLQAEGVTFHLDSAIEGMRDLGAEREVTIRQGESLTVLRAELVLVALGRSPNTRGLGLDGIGVELSPRGGLRTDSRLRTTRKHIYAAGDATGQYLFTHAAGYEGGIVVANAVLRLPRSVDYRWFPWCTYTDPELASIGMNEGMAREAGIEHSVVAEEFRANDRALAEDETVGKVKLVLDARERPIGVQILGPRAGDLIAEWAAVLNGGVKLSTLASTVHPYPTLGEINKRVAGAYLAPKIFSDRVRKGLRLFFNLKGRACGPELPGTGCDT